MTLRTKIEEAIMSETIDMYTTANLKTWDGEDIYLITYSNLLSLIASLEEGKGQ